MDADVDDKVDDVDIFLDWEPRLNMGPQKRRLSSSLITATFFSLSLSFVDRTNSEEGSDDNAKSCKDTAHNDPRTQHLEQNNICSVLIK